MKVKDLDGNPIPHLSKENGSIISDDRDAYHKRLAQIRQRKRIDNMETEQKQMGDDLAEIKQTLDYLVKLLKEK